MQNGFYKFTFEVPYPKFITPSTLILHLQGDKLTGGDLQHLYMGKVHREGEKVEIDLKLTKYFEAAREVFDPIIVIAIAISGKVTERTLSEMVTKQVTAKGTLFKGNGTSDILRLADIVCTATHIHEDF
jgi:hypothetical protein